MTDYRVDRAAMCGFATPTSHQSTRHPPLLYCFSMGKIPLCLKLRSRIPKLKTFGNFLDPMLSGACAFRKIGPEYVKAYGLDCRAAIRSGATMHGSGGSIYHWASCALLFETNSVPH
jgi:hypothetical protein